MGLMGFVRSCERSGHRSPRSALGGRIFGGCAQERLAGSVCISAYSHGSCAERCGAGGYSSVSAHNKTICAHRWTWILGRSEEHTSELQSLMRISYAVFCLKKKKIKKYNKYTYSKE